MSCFVAAAPRFGRVTVVVGLAAIVLAAVGFRAAGARLRVCFAAFVVVVVGRVGLRGEVVGTWGAGRAGLMGEVGFWGERL